MSATSPSPPEQRTGVYRFGDFVLDVGSGFLRCGGRPIELRAKAFELLVYLVERHGRVVSKDEMAGALWPKVAVTDNSLAQCVAQVRRALGDTGRAFIHTIPRRGYVFAADGRAMTTPPADAAPAAAIAAAHHMWPALSSGSEPPVTRAARRPPSIAVLPFENLSADPENEYFSDGLAEEILNLLARTPGLKVTARTSAFAFKGRNEDVRAIAAALGVEHVLEGSVRKAGRRIRVTAQLIAASDGSHLWSDRYERELQDVFAIQDDIASAIASALRVQLRDRQRPSGRETGSVAAHHRYLKGRYQWGKRTARALRAAIEHYREAIAIDPTYGPAYAGLAECYIPLAYYGHMLPRDAWVHARAAALRASEIDPTLAEARTVLGWARTHLDHDLAAGEEEIRRAIADAPDYSRAHQALAEHLVATGRFEEAAGEIHCALDSDPVALNINAAVALIDYLSGAYDQAADQFRRTLDLDPYFYPAHWYLGQVYSQQCRFDEALHELKEAAALSDGSTSVTAIIGVVYAAAGDADRARELLHRLDHESERRYVSHVFTAAIAARLGDRKDALARLARAFDDRCPWLLFLLVDPKLEALRGDAQFNDLAFRLGLAPRA